MRIHAFKLWRWSVAAAVCAFWIGVQFVPASLVLAAELIEHVDITPDFPSGHGSVGDTIEIAQARGGTTTIAKTTSGRKNVARKAILTGNGSKTTFQLELSQGVPAEVFTLANPYRVVIDLPDVAFSLPEDAGRSGRGLVSAFRFGLFAARKARVVLDTVAPVQIDKAEMRAKSGGGVVLEIVFSKTDRISFGSGTGAVRSGPKVRRSDGDGRVATGKRARRAKPVVMIDPGHGGIDPGALGSGKSREKGIVLAVAKRLKKKLTETGRYSVFMTRGGDVFISLDRRIEASKRRSADVFISLHADAIADTRFAGTVSGATVYTLSSRASDEEARLIAEKENSADAVAGLQTGQSDRAVEVRNILIDLLKRETANFSTDLSNALVEKLKGAVRMSRKPRRSADFKVLRQTRTPSVLIELGYMSNKRDVELMAGAQWQSRAATAIAASIDTYFARRSRQAR